MRSWDSSPHSPPSSKYNLIPAVREVYCTGEVGAVWFHCLPTASVGDFQLKLQSSRVFKQQRVCNRRTLQKWKRPLLLLFHRALQEVCAKTVIPARGDTLKVHQKKRLLWGRIYQVWSQRWVLLFFFFVKVVTLSLNERPCLSLANLHWNLLSRYFAFLCGVKVWPVNMRAPEPVKLQYLDDQFWLLFDLNSEEPLGYLTQLLTYRAWPLETAWMWNQLSVLGALRW